MFFGFMYNAKKKKKSAPVHRSSAPAYRASTCPTYGLSEMWNT